VDTDTASSSATASLVGSSLRAASGVAALLVGGQVLALLVVLGLVSGVRPARLHQWWLAATVAVAVGWVLASDGRLGLRPVVRTIRRATGLGWVTILLAGAVTVGVVPAVIRQAGSTGRTATAGAVVLQLVLATVYGLWVRDRVPGGAPQRMAPRGVANLAVVSFLAMSAVTVALKLPDIYPLSRYPMYSGVRLDPYTATQVRFVGVEEGGREVDLPPPGSRNVLVQLAADGDVERLRELAAQVQAQRGVAGVRVVLEESRIAPYPAPASIEQVSGEELVRLGLE
jgi:hypothetical protein